MSARSTLKFLSDIHRLARGRQDAKSVIRQWLEMTAFFVILGNGPGYYQLAALWQRRQTWAEFSGHWSFKRYIAELERINPTEYRKISQHKVVEKALLNLMGIPTPRYIGVLDADAGRDAEGNPLRGSDDLARLFKRETASWVCFKLVEGWSGIGFVAADIIRGAGGTRFRLLNEERERTAAELVAVLDLAPGKARLIEDYMLQHPVYASFNPSSVNTLRLGVRRHGAAATTRFGYLRVGRQGSLVDNIRAGGIVGTLDLASGSVREAHDGLPTRTTYSVHPDHGAPIVGVPLPNFGAAMDLAERCLMVFPNMNYAGIDVAMAVDGPRIIELNVQPDPQAPLYGGLSLREALSDDIPPVIT